MSTLGERIRKLRKQQKMTLETLAGTELTKGMLSLIENNKANPSMESLNYIAERLNVDVTNLLEEVSNLELRDILEKAEILFSTNYEDLTNEHEQLIELVKPYVPKLTQGYEAARLLEMYSRCLAFTNNSDSEDLLKQVAVMYEQLNLTTKRADIGTSLAVIPYRKHQYQESLDILLAERGKLEANPLWIDPLSRLDYDYLEATLYFAVGKYEEAIRVMEKAIHYSNKHKIFKQVDNLYRLAAAQAMMAEDEIKKEYYLNKLLAYSEFADDEDSKIFTYYAEIHYLNSYKKMYEEANHLFNALSIKGINKKLFTPFFLLEKGKILYGLEQYEQAIDKLQEVVIPDVLHHPIDLSIFYEKDAYIALCYLELDQQEKAMEAVQVALDNIREMPDTPYKKYIEEIYKKVSSPHQN
ncbi:helix-turn-helix domain-containing protein [Psychrobacillus lasiicapitis]|uniref:Helix-turn-helix transcriptional regulator n=1 Tax=Psychrobacillus lasiicapitis TaxID=1636719 RepID=A0A544T5D7_9BACI|nr:helix-turn-helix transcriptional regulator [Psychrobacillus lasiicapitis]TQR12657.1 helix-turn-helix transcriptional regulator [Psychrobacillus lasiicapitis]GGA39886.1 transcriptional regulator [Psychrobacillus lasiicapitis]